VLFAAALALLPSGVFAQALATPTGHEVSVTVSGYNYVEPGPLKISIHGPKFGGEYLGTLPLDRNRHWFAQADVRGTIGRAAYDGWCAPWLITPNSASPNGYELDLGDYSPCNETGDRDWYVEARGLAGKDLIGGTWGLSPFAGLGVRHLSNGTTGAPGFRTDTYLYPPLGVTARTMIASDRALSVTVEFDPLIRGWQQTRESKLGGGVVPATATAPEFTIEGLSDVSFTQHSGWALRASASYPVTRTWSIEPYYIHWRVGDSPVNDTTATFTVNGVTASEQLGFYEPFNTTNEFGVRVGVRFGGGR
jgi:hypothetical protein